MPANDFITVYTTVSTTDEASLIARTLVDKRLVACANVFEGPDSLGGVRSFYHWQGDVQEDREVALLCKTRRELFDAVAAEIRRVHSYETPCIVAWNIEAIDDSYAAWILAETVSPESPQP